MRVYQKFDISLPHDVEEQYDYGSQVPKFAAGDLALFKEQCRANTHGRIATGRGTVIHASSYWNEVTETCIKYIKGYAGAKRLL